VHRAAITAEPGGPRLAGETVAGPVPSAPVRSAVPGVDRATRAFTALVASHDLTVRIGVIAVVAAFVLGAFHAIAPGHGKTVMAAYLVGQRGTLRQGLGIGAGVTLTHTAGVIVLGLVLSVSSVAAPERVYPYLGAASGALLASIGIALLARARRLRRRGVAAIWHGHHHTPGAAHDHAHHEHGHAHGHAHHDHAHHDDARHGHDHDHDGDTTPEGPLGWRWVVAMGFAGGMVPSPSALVVLLGAIALGRTWFGVALVLAYGAGMAATLVVAGLLLVRARARIERIVDTDRGRRMTRALTVLPMITAVVIVAGGLMLAARALGEL
jgi:ABC-type nickel/cobalt efflux system permease component RcnA